MPKNYTHLNLGIHPLKESYIEEYLKTNSHFRLTENQINPEFITFLKGHLIDIKHAESFYSVPYLHQPIHKDGLADQLSVTKMNFVFGGKNSLMSWYNAKSGVTGASYKTVTGSNYQQFDIDQVDFIESTTIRFPTLVNAATAHNIKNREEPRHCLSITLTNLNSSEYASMDEILTKLKDFIID